MSKDNKIKALADKVAKDIVDQMSEDDRRSVALYGAGPWSEGVSAMPFWDEDDEVKALSDGRKEELLEAILWKMSDLCILEVIRDCKGAERCRWMVEGGYGDGAVECYGAIPNTNDAGWYFAGYADELLREIGIMYEGKKEAR